MAVKSKTDARSRRHARLRKKVVGTEWNVVESLVSLGVDPVGVADVKGYTTWDSAAPLKNEPKDIGTRGEPSMDTIAGLSPDLIVATSDLPAAALKQLRKVAPVLEVRSADAADPIGQMTQNLDLIAEPRGRGGAQVAARELKAVRRGERDFLVGRDGRCPHGGEHGRLGEDPRDDAGVSHPDVQQQGRHPELMASGGLYADLYRTLVRSQPVAGHA